MITILLSTYNGEQFLEDQLKSLRDQTYQNFKVIARDDASSDNTLNILNYYGIEALKSEKTVGVKKSFSLLLEYALKNTDSAYFMFCDQDDIWEHDKIEKTLQSIQKLEKKYSDTPCLIHSDLKVVNENLHLIDNSFMHYQKIDAIHNNLHNLLLQNTITGCTVMINRKLTELAYPIPNESMMHDWWIGLIASYFGKIGYIDRATIKYRQHSNNCVGAKGFNMNFIFARLFKTQILSNNILQAKRFLDIYKDYLNVSTVEMLEDFTTIESKSFWQKRKILLKHKLLKQGILRNIGLLLKI